MKINEPNLISFVECYTKKKQQTQRKNECWTKQQNNESLHESNVCVSNLFFYSVIQTNKITKINT